MTPKERVAMQQALEALEMYRPLFLPIKLLSQDKTREEAITALREALAEQAEQEPVAWWMTNGEFTSNEWEAKADGPDATPLYAAPVRTKDLTEQEIQDAIINISPTGTGYFLRIARAVIAAYKEKNK